MDEYKDKLGGLADRLKKSPPRTPLQQVQPLHAEAEPKAVEVQFNNWIPKALLKRLKAYALEQETSLKDINIKALELFLKVATNNN